MKKNAAAFVAGLVFAIGLAVAGMTQPSKVIGFLDWDPSLMFVMAGAIAVHLAILRVVLKRRRPLLAEAFRVPTRRDLTPQLFAGAALFGVGWGLGGFCPGPGIASVGTLGAHALVFTGTMALGMLVHRWAGATRSD